MGEEQATAQLIPYLKEQGLRITPQRLLILEAIQKLKSHPTVEDIHHELPYISLATIYNNVKLFVKLNILKELPYGTGISKYEMYKTNHYHIICEACGKIGDFNYPLLKEVEQAAEKLTKFDIQFHHFEVYGICKECQKLK
ncbi:Fur family transcriptional regulator [Heyndrickxia sp. NPDC080065]|uniref:Fur family transcriptional regulator n=1 Tax=Heyndrickxia sp. NPDC080065 TaxID=3390568 RepID=UPI003D0792BE